MSAPLPPLPDPSAKRDRWARRIGWSLFGVALGSYLLCDSLGAVPEAWSVRLRSARRANPQPIDLGWGAYDPDLVLGVAIGDTRYRFNYAKSFAVVMRPLFGVTDWVVPEEVIYLGQRFRVTALDPFALMNATTVEQARFPRSLRWLNGAPALATQRLKRLVLEGRSGEEQVFLPPFEALEAYTEKPLYETEESQE